MVVKKMDLFMLLLCSLLASASVSSKFLQNTLSDGYLFIFVFEFLWALFLQGEKFHPK